jgi:hypothetical protein
MELDIPTRHATCEWLCKSYVNSKKVEFQVAKPQAASNLDCVLAAIPHGRFSPESVDLSPWVMVLQV